MKIVLNINIRSVLTLDRNLVGGDEVVRSSSFPTCRHDGGRGCRSAVLRGDHHRDVVWGSMWSELGRAAQDVVDVVCGRSSAELLGTRLTWSVVWSTNPGRGRVDERSLDGLFMVRCGSVSGSLGSTWLARWLGCLDVFCMVSM